MIGYVKNYWAWIMVITLSSFGCSMANVYIVDLLKRVIDLSISKGADFSLWILIAQAVVAILVGMLSNYLVVRTAGAFKSVILRDLRRDTVNHIMRVAPSDMEKQNFGDIMERLSSDIAVVSGYMETYFKDCLYVPIVVTVFTVYLIAMNPLLAVLCLGPLFIMVPISIKLLKPVKMAQTEYVKKLGLTNNHIQEVFDGVDVIKSYNLQERMQKKYYDARHVCYAYMLGAARKDFRANDNGEPSGTAGKPILGQINSNELTDILIIVVRYFGGIKLGTSGLIVAYKAAAAEAIAAATIIEKTVDEDVTVMFEYPFMNDVMRIVKEEEPEILNQSYDMDCSMTLRIRRSMMPKLRARLEKVETARILDDENVL